MRKSKPKVAIIGTSLINCMIASKLAAEYDVHMFESGRIGGAWGSSTFYFQRVPIANNLICPLNWAEERFIDSISLILEKLGCSIQVQSDPLHLLSEYSPNRYILGDFSPAFRTLLSSRINLLREKVRSIEISESHTKINGEEFFRLVLPRNFSVNKVSVFGELAVLDEVSTVSQHFRARFSRPIHPSDSIMEHNFEYSYTENFDRSFDRGGVFKSYYFIGRVRRECKKLPTTALIARSELFSTQPAIAVERNVFVNTRVADASWDNLVKKAEGSAATFIDASQFISGYTSHLDILQNIFKLGRCND